MAGAASVRPRVVVIPIRREGQCGSCGARASSVCSGAIEERDVTRLAALAVVTHFPAGHIFIEENTPADSFFNITGGTAKLFKLLPDGRRQITGFAHIGHFLGLAAGTRYNFSAEAVDAVTACRFKRQGLRNLMHETPQMEERLLQVASSELIAAQDQMLLLGRKTARERVASFLLSRTETNAPCATPSDRVSLPMTRTDIADYLGLTIETVSRTLTRLRTDGLVEALADHGLRILARERLQEIAAGAG